MFWVVLIIVCRHIGGLLVYWAVLMVFGGHIVGVRTVFVGAVVRCFW